MQEINVIDLEIFKNILQEKIALEINKLGEDANLRLYTNEKDITEEEQELTKGLITLRSSSLIPIQQIRNYTLNIDLMIILKQEKINIYQKALFNTVTNLAGTILKSDRFNFDDATVIFNSDLPTLGSTEIRAKEGLTTPIFLSISLQCIKNGLVTNKFNIKLDDKELHPLSYSFQRAKMLEALNIIDNQEILNISNSQTLVIQMQLLYTKDEIIQKLSKDIIKGDNKTIYNFTFSKDEEILIDEKLLIRDAVLSLEAGKIPLINISFVLADEVIYKE